jgi:hypothetical protein
MCYILHYCEVPLELSQGFVWNETHRFEAVDTDDEKHNADQENDCAHRQGRNSRAETRLNETRHSRFQKNDRSRQENDKTCGNQRERAAKILELLADLRPGKLPFAAKERRQLAQQIANDVRKRAGGIVHHCGNWLVLDG